MCVRVWLSAGDKDKYNVYMRVFTCLYQSWTTTRGQTERERERQHERTLSRSASISHSFFLSRTRAHNTTVDRSAVAVAAVDPVHSASQLSMHTMKMMIYIIYRFACECDCWSWALTAIDLLPLLMIYVIGCILVMRTVCAFLCAPAVHQLIVIAHYIANQCN